MFDTKPKIKVLIIGKDGTARKYWVEHDAEFYNSRYKIDFDAVYQSLEGGFLGLGAHSVPTIMFRENNVIAISFKVRPSMPDPEEMGSSISRAAWAIAELMKKKNEGLMQLMMILMIAAVIISGAGAYMAYSANDKITKLDTKINGMSIGGGNQSYTPPGGIPAPTPYRTPTPFITSVPTPTPTPHPGGISVT
jgi:hypothetical protein